MFVRSGVIAAWTVIASSAAAWGLCMAPAKQASVAWDTKDTPFDIARFQELPAPEINAAPLYLDAFYEFTPSVESCFSEAERALRTPIAKRRERLAQDVLANLRATADRSDAEKIDTLLADHKTGFEKLRLAQQRVDCVFGDHMGAEPGAGHADAAWHVVRLLSLKARRAVDRGRLSEAITDIETALRLGRDLRPRGSAGSQKSSSLIDTLVFSDMVQRVLAARELSIDQTRRLLAVITSHARTSEDMFLTALRRAYVDGRTRLFEQSRHARQEEGSSSATSPVKRDGENLADHQSAVLSPERYRMEIRALNRSFTAILEDRKIAFAAESTRLMTLLSTLNETTATKFILADVPAVFALVTNHDTLQNATICLVAVRLWQLSQSKPVPDDLSAITAAAGLSSVPADPYSGNVMKLTLATGKPVIYSVGKNGRDDEGMPARDFEQKTGDILFEISESR